MSPSIASGWRRGSLRDASDYSIGCVSVFLDLSISQSVVVSVLTIGFVCSPLPLSQVFPSCEVQLVKLQVAVINSGAVSWEADEVSEAGMDMGKQRFLEHNLQNISRRTMIFEEVYQQECECRIEERSRATSLVSTCSEKEKGKSSNRFAMRTVLIHCFMSLVVVPNVNMQRVPNYPSQ